MKSTNFISVISTLCIRIMPIKVSHARWTWKRIVVVNPPKLNRIFDAAHALHYLVRYYCKVLLSWSLSSDSFVSVGNWYSVDNHRERVPGSWCPNTYLYCSGLAYCSTCLLCRRDIHCILAAQRGNLSLVHQWH